MVLRTNEKDDCDTTAHLEDVRLLKVRGVIGTTTQRKVVGRWHKNSTDADTEQT